MPDAVVLASVSSRKSHFTYAALSALRCASQRVTKLRSRAASNAYSIACRLLGHHLHAGGDLKRRSQRAVHGTPFSVHAVNAIHSFADFVGIRGAQVKRHGALGG
jgi:hypothetical protein